MYTLAFSPPGGIGANANGVSEAEESSIEITDNGIETRISTFALLHIQPTPGRCSNCRTPALRLPRQELRELALDAGGSAEVTQPGREDDALRIDALFMIKYGAQVVKRSAVAAARLK